MHTRAYCPRCGWVGIAEVGKGTTIEEYKCPICGNLCIKRPYRGTRDLKDKEAQPKTKRGKHESLNNQAGSRRYG